MGKICLTADKIYAEYIQKAVGELREKKETS
jgi:hypothetical protein